MRQRRIERRRQDGRRESKEKTHFCNYANGASGLSGLGRPVGFNLRERRGQWEPAGPKAEWAARSTGPKARKKNFRIKNWIFEFTKDLDICRRRFRRNFDMRIFLNSSRLLKDFRKI
jgi:hypothetical protein